MTNIDDFFSHTSMEAARSIIGMQIQANNSLYTVTATKAYYGDSRQVQNKPRLRQGGIMMFNLRGSFHFCVASGEGPEQDYLLIARLLDNGEEIKNPGRVSQVLGLTMEHDGKRFDDYLTLRGQTARSKFTGDNKVKSCLGLYEIVR